MSRTAINILILIVVLSLAYLGQSSIKLGLKEVGEFSFSSVSGFFSFFLRCATTPHVIVGAFIVAMGFAGWVAFLSRMDLSQALPLLAVSYIPWLFIGYFFFGEPVDLKRVIGVLLITAGVVLVGQSGAIKTTPAAVNAPER